ncbi:hypothetical protein [Sandarakinorhabdus oryzae]|uniref:hypothetical protein n=1 Tax=Sandarakinorhabdus oryzae TaxID=2675220 RepID=UPI0012E305DF|nr:hypothetical protein [Sandarakinorhabdus oryzae]
MSLGEALDEVRKIERLYRNANVDREAAAKLIGYSGLSGPANKALAALAQYGLVERAGKGEMRVTARAKAILHPDHESEKREQLRFAAFEPNLFRELQDRYPDMIPPYEGVETFLNRKGFNQSAIRPAAKAYLDTLQLLTDEGASKQSAGQRQSDEGSQNEPGEESRFGAPQVGDLVDYEIGGVIANAEPLRVRAISSDAKWVFVDGSEVGLEVANVFVKQRPLGGDGAPLERPTMPLPKEEPPEPPAKGMRKAMFPLDDGDVTLIFPETITASGLSDLADYLEIFLRKERRKKEQG